MFSVLCINSQPRRKFSRKCAVEALLSPVKAAAPYKVINVTPGKKGIDWKTVCLAAGCSSRSMLLPEAVEVPLSVPIARFEPQVLPLLTALNTAVLLCDKNDRHKLSLAVCDSKAVLAGYLPGAVPYASRITVVTDCPEMYLECAAQIMEDFGAVIKICSQIDSSTVYDIAVSDKERINAGICVTADDVKKNADKINFPDEYVRMCPPQIDVFDFVCALFECSGVKNLTDVKLCNL